MCSSDLEFRENYCSAYNACVKNKWLDELCSDLHRILRKKGYWTKEKCKEESLKYKTKMEFQTYNLFVYNVSRKNKWINEFFPSKFNKDMCLKEALKYKTKKEFRENNYRVYDLAYQHRWLNEICSHMKELRKPNRYWTKERCKDVALLCETKKEISNKYAVAYGVITKNKWNELISHFIEERKPNGYWTKEKCKEVALTCRTKKEFIEKYSNPHTLAIKNGWLNEICSHMKELRKPNGYWTKERCHEEALKYTTKNEFRNNNLSSYDISYRNKWLKEICIHMIKTIKENDKSK